MPKNIFPEIWGERAPLFLRLLRLWCCGECFAAKDPTEPVEAAMRRLEARWMDVMSRVSASKETVTASNVVAQFSTELDSLTNTIDIYDSWATSEATNVAKDFVQLSQQLDQCRVRFIIE